MLKKTLRRVLHAYIEGGGIKGVVAGVVRKSKGPREAASSMTAKTAGHGMEKTSLPALHPFDVEFGTDTSGTVGFEGLVSGSSSDYWNTTYYGISPSGFNQIMEAVDLDWERFTFIDLGCGKGRALLLASRFPFRKIIGVELGPELGAVAKTNAAQFSPPWQTCKTIDARTGDAAKFEFPEGPIVLYLYHPFLAPVMKKVLKNLEKSLAGSPREVYILFVHPVLEALTKRVPGFVRLWQRFFAFSEQDQQADRVGAKGDEVVVWAVSAIVVSLVVVN